MIGAIGEGIADASSGNAFFRSAATFPLAGCAVSPLRRMMRADSFVGSVVAIVNAVANAGMRDADVRVEAAEPEGEGKNIINNQTNDAILSIENSSTSERWWPLVFFKICLCLSFCLSLSIFP